MIGYDGLESLSVWFCTQLLVFWILCSMLANILRFQVVLGVVGDHFCDEQGWFIMWVTLYKDIIIVGVRHRIMG